MLKKHYFIPNLTKITYCISIESKHPIKNKMVHQNMKIQKEKHNKIESYTIQFKNIKSTSLCNS